MVEKKKFGELVMAIEEEGFEVTLDDSLGFYIIEDTEGHICTMEVKEHQKENLQGNLVFGTQVYVMDGEAKTIVNPIENLKDIIGSIFDACEYEFEEVEY